MAGRYLVMQTYLKPSWTQRQLMRHAQKPDVFCICWGSSWLRTNCAGFDVALRVWARIQTCSVTDDWLNETNAKLKGKTSLHQVGDWVRYACFNRQIKKRCSCGLPEQLLGTKENKWTFRTRSSSWQLDQVGLLFEPPGRSPETSGKPTSEFTLGTETWKKHIRMYTLYKWLSHLTNKSFDVLNPLVNNP